MEQAKNFENLQQTEGKKKKVEFLLRKWLLPITLCLSDYLAVLSALVCAYGLRQYVFDFGGTPLLVPDTLLYIVIPVTFLFFLHYDKLYVRGLPFWQEAEKIVKASSYSILFVILFLYLTGAAGEISRIFMGGSWLFACLFINGNRFFLQKVLLNITFLQTPVLVFGAGKTLSLMLGSFKDSGCFGYRIIGILEDSYLKGQAFKGYPILGKFSEAEDIIKSTQVQDVLIAAPGLSREVLTSLVYKIQPHVENITFVPDLFGIPVRGIQVESLFDEKVVLLKVCNNLSKYHNLILKRLSDIILSIIAFPFVVIVVGLISLCIIIDSKGPVLYKASRLGQSGTAFCCYKFRTMHENHQKDFEEFLQNNPNAQQEWLKYAKIKECDPRVTKVGRFLRRYSLDELPQILNVFLGDMSFVGPRPYLPRERHQMKFYRQTILQSKPGITGLWQVSGRNELTFEQRLHLDAWYVRNWSLWLDFVMLCKTIRVVLLRKGAY